jgi:hypothetical protein
LKRDTQSIVATQLVVFLFVFGETLVIEHATNVTQDPLSKGFLSKIQKELCQWLLLLGGGADDCFEGNTGILVWWVDRSHCA